MNFKEEHIAHNYFVKIKQVPHIRGLLVKFPRNIYLEKDEIERLYEITESHVIIYQDSKVLEKIECPEYCGVYLMSIDVCCEMERRYISLNLIRGYDCNDVCISSEEYQLGLNDLVKPSKNPNTRRMQFQLGRFMADFIKNNGSEQIPIELLEGFKVVMDRHIKGTQNE